jgi:hypothetical protein
MFVNNKDYRIALGMNWTAASVSAHRQTGYPVIAVDVGLGGGRIVKGICFSYLNFPL